MSGRAAISFNERPPSTRSYTSTPPPCMPPNTIQRESSPPTAAPRKFCRPVCTSATRVGIARSSSEKIATVSPSALGSYLFVAYRNGAGRERAPLSSLHASSLSAGERSSPATARSAGPSPGWSWKVDVVLRSLGEAGSGGRWCAKRLLVSSLTVYRTSSVYALCAHTIRDLSRGRNVRGAERGKRTNRGKRRAVVHCQGGTSLSPARRALRSSAIVRKGPRPVGAQIGDENLVAPGNGYDLVWV